MPKKHERFGRMCWTSSVFGKETSSTAFGQVICKSFGIGRRMRKATGRIFLYRYLRKFVKGAPLAVRPSMCELFHSRSNCVTSDTVYLSRALDEHIAALCKVRGKERQANPKIRPDHIFGLKRHPFKDMPAFRGLFLPFFACEYKNRKNSTLSRSIYQGAMVRK